jgi:hypothetical protein
MELSELFLDRYLYRDNEQDSSTKDSVFESADSSGEDPYSIPAGGAAQDINTSNVYINGENIEPGTIPQAVLDVSNWGWTQSCVFSSTDADTVSWSAGTFTSAGGDSYSISAGNTGNMSSKTYIYLDLNVSETAYQTTTTSADSVGIGKVIIGVAENGASSATYDLTEANQIVGDNILANTIDASKMNVGQLSSISANIGSITSGTITGATIRTSSSGRRVELNDGNNDMSIYDASVRRARGYDSGWTFYNPSGATVADIYAGTTALGTASLLLTASGTASGSIYLNSGSSGSVGMYVNGTAYLTASGSSGEVILNKDMMPVGTRYLGAITSPFETVWAENFAYNGTLNIVSDGEVNVQGDIVPSSDSNYDLGTSSIRWGRLYADTIDMNGDIDMNDNDIFAVKSITLNGVGDFLDCNSGFIDNARAIYMETGRTTNPSISGEIRYYDGASKGFRGYVNGFLGQFDLSTP